MVTWDETYLDGIVGLWNRELTSHFPMRETLFKQNSFTDENVCRAGSAIMLDQTGHVAGFIVVKRWQENLHVNMPETTGWIQVLLVDHRCRNLGIGSRLLTHAEDVLRSKGMKEILLGRDPWHYFPGIPEADNETKRWFEAKGYESYAKEHDMLRIYDHEVTITEPQLPQVTFGIMTPSDKPALLAFLNRCFPGRWEYEAIKYFEAGGTGREFIVLRKAGTIIGFCRVNDSSSPIIAQNVYWAPVFEGELGGVGPLGVDSAERGQGYGLAIVEAGIAELRKRTINQLVIDWTGLVDFYKRLGYDIWKSYDSYKKIL